MHTTNYVSTFIVVAPDTTATVATVPDKPGTVATLQYEMLAAKPYAMTSDDLLFAVYAARNDVKPSKATREAFFAKPQACLRASPLPKTYGFGLHHDAKGRVALVPMESARYADLSDDPHVKTVAAMRSKAKGAGK